MTSTLSDLFLLLALQNRLILSVIVYKRKKVLLLKRYIINYKKEKKKTTPNNGGSISLWVSCEHFFPFHPRQTLFLQF